MTSSRAPFGRAGRWLAVVALVLAFASFARSLSTLPARRQAALTPGTEPFLWRRVTPSVRALERLLDAHRDALGAGVPVLVVARDPGGADAGFVWHWAQYLAPRANFLAAGEVGAETPVALVLGWGDVPAEPSWRRLGAEDGFALYEVVR